jgi:hypothetical protein
MSDVPNLPGVPPLAAYGAPAGELPGPAMSLLFVIAATTARVGKG